MDLPRITVVMPSYNQVAFLEESLCSVLDQHYPNLEFMVLDAGSTDGSRAIIERYDHALSYWRSERDDGQSAAIDEGIKRSTGELAGWLNSDDVLLPGALRAVGEAYRQHPTGGLFAGNLVLMDFRGIITGFLRMPAQAEWFARRGLFAVSGPGSFFRTIDYHDAGGVRHDLHYVMDNELYLRMMLRGTSFVYIDRYLAAFRRHGQQKTSAFKGKVQQEVNRLDEDLRAEYGIPYNSATARTVYYFRQIINGNYLRKRFHLLGARRRHWSEWARTAFVARSEVGS